MSRTSIRFGIDPAQWARAERLMSSKELGKAIQSATVKTTRNLRAEIVRIARKKAKLTTKAVNKVVKSYTYVNGAKSEGRVVVKRDPLPLTEFMTAGQIAAARRRGKKRKRGGLRVQVWKDKPPLVFKHGFGARYKGHVNMFERVKGSDLGGQLTRSGYARRFPIKKLWGASVHSIMSVPAVLAEASKYAVTQMYKNFEGQFSRFGYAA